MIADSGTASPPVAGIEWEGVLVGALGCAVTNTHCVGCIKPGCSDK